MQIPPEPLRQILQSGIAAPSAENKHYLRFEVAPDHTLLWATDAASWADLPHRRFLALLSYGAVAENMALRAGELGYSQEVRWRPDPLRSDCIARFDWTPSLSGPSPLAAAIPQRHTNRRFYRRGALPASALQRLSDATQAVPEASLLWLDKPSLRAAALEAIRRAETERFCRRELHRELFGAVRFDIGWKQTTQEWLPPGALEVEPPMRLPFALLRRWPLMHALSLAGAHHMLGLRAADLPCRLAPHLGLIVAGGVDAADRAVQAGRALQRAWLAAAAEGLAFQPMAAATVLAQQRAGDGWVSPQTQARLITLLAQLSPSPSAQPCMFFRLGRAAPPTVVTERQSLDSYLAAPMAGLIAAQSEGAGEWQARL
jgi:hypothetical protein